MWLLKIQNVHACIVGTLGPCRNKCTPKQKPDFELFYSTTIFISTDILGQKQENWIKNFIYQS